MRRTLRTPTTMGLQKVTSPNTSKKVTDKDMRRSQSTRKEEEGGTRKRVTSQGMWRGKQ